MAWSIFKDGGGHAEAVKWAKDLLTALPAPLSTGNITFIYQWERSEGGGGKYNPLNQGPVPGRPELTTTGQQFGGGAADYASYDAGIQGAVAYLHMPNYTHVLENLQADNPAGAKDALIASPWAGGHYGGGSHFSTATIPSDLLGEIPLTPEEHQMLADVHAFVTTQSDKVGGGLPWDATQTLNIVHQLQQDIAAVKTHLGIQ